MEWLGIELHPETPPEGKAITEMFRVEDTSRMMQHLRSMGAPYGIVFSDIVRISNSRLALQAAEFAREQGRFEEFHSRLLQAYFSGGLDIGDSEVLSQIALETGLDVKAMEKALNEGTYLLTLKQVQEEATRLGVTGVPAFFLGEKKAIVGAQSIDVFRKALRGL